MTKAYPCYCPTDVVCRCRNKLPSPCAPDWDDLAEKYLFPNQDGNCTCYGDSGPCRFCEDGWQELIDWDKERVTTGYVEDFKG